MWTDKLQEIKKMEAIWEEFDAMDLLVNKLLVDALQ